MKKTTLLRKTAYLVSPQIADGFVPPANFDYKISVSLHEVDIKIYGFTGTSWELMHDSDGVIASFETEVQHQKYYFESKSGQEQTVRVSFLSTEDAPGAGIRTGVTSETRRFYDIEEIPVYNGSRDGAMLTVMSDGSLAWLLVNESFIIPGEGGAQPLSFTELFLEESQSFYDTNNPKSQVSIQDFDGDGNIYVRTEQTYSSATIPVSEVMTFDGDHPEASKFTMSLWFKTAGTNRSDFRIAGFKTSTSGFGMRITNSSTRLELINFIDTHPKITLPSTMDNSWHHVCMTYEAFELDGVTPLSAGGFASGDSIYHKMTCYYDGSSNSVVVEGASTGRLFKEDVTGDFHLGALPGINGNGQTGRRFFDSVEMIEGLALTGAQVDSIYSDTTRQTSAADVS